jgi:starvation-inducible DNA-binding protein
VTQLKDHEAATLATKPPVEAGMADWNTITALNRCLAHAIELRSRIKQAHWGAKGENFYVFHQMSDDFTVQLDKQADKLSARLVVIGGVPAWMPSTVASTSILPEYPADIVRVSEYVEALLASYIIATKPLPALIGKLTSLDDFVTANVVASFSKVLEEQKGFLAAHGGIAWLEKRKKIKAN